MLSSRKVPGINAWRGNKFNILNLTRVTTSGRVIFEIDGLRFIAISCVVFLHFLAQIAPKNNLPLSYSGYNGISRIIYWIGSQGHYGVQLFFVISGLVLGLQFTNAHRNGNPAPALRVFYLRRITRLEPPYILSLIVSYVIVALLFSRGLIKNGDDFWGGAFTALRC